VTISVLLFWSVVLVVVRGQSWLRMGKGEILPLIREATELKLRPTQDIRYDVVKRWFQVRRVFLHTMWNFMKLHAKTTVSVELGCGAGDGSSDLVRRSVHPK
jgi:hypothetical protein